MQVQTEESGLCPWWHGQTNKVPWGIHQSPGLPIIHFQHWPLTPVYGWFCSVSISFFLLVSVPVLGEEPALPQPLFLPRPWQMPEQGCLGTLVWDTAGVWLGLGTGD